MFSRHLITITALVFSSAAWGWGGLSIDSSDQDHDSPKASASSQTRDTNPDEAQRKIYELFSKTETESGNLVIDNLKNWSTISDEEVKQTKAAILAALSKLNLPLLNGLKAEQLRVNYGPGANSILLHSAQGVPRDQAFQLSLGPSGRVGVTLYPGGQTIVEAVRRFREAVLAQHRTAQLVPDPTEVLRSLRQILPHGLDPKKVTAELRFGPVDLDGTRTSFVEIRSNHGDEAKSLILWSDGAIMGPLINGHTFPILPGTKAEASAEPRVEPKREEISEALAPKPPIRSLPKPEAVAATLKANLASLEKLGKKGTDGKFVVAEAELTTLKQNLANTLGLEASRMGIALNPETESGLNGGAIVLHDRESTKVIIISPNGKSISMEDPFVVGTYKDAQGKEQLLSMYYEQGAKGDPWRVNVGTRPASIYMDTPHDSFKTSFSVRGDHTYDRTFLVDPDGTVVRLGRSRGGSVTDVGGSKLVELK